MNALQLEGVDKIYQQRGKTLFYAVKELNLTVREGEIFCLLGPNGSGKTTTINLITGLDRADRGTIQVLGYHPVKEAKMVRRLIGIVPQETALYNDLTARENLLFHAGYYGMSREKWETATNNMLELVGLAERQHDRVGTYSGGMQRRLALARALLTAPKLLLLDEPTLGVDVHSRNAIWNRIKMLAREGTTVFLTTNYMEEAEFLADRIAIIDHGRNIVTGSLPELKDRLGEKRMVFRFTDPRNAQTKYEILRPDYRVKIDENEVTVFISGGEEWKLVHEIGRTPEEVNSFAVIEPTLNDVFLHFTGRDLRD